MFKLFILFLLLSFIQLLVLSAIKTFLPFKKASLNHYLSNLFWYKKTHNFIFRSNDYISIHLTISFSYYLFLWLAIIFLAQSTSLKQLITFALLSWALIAIVTPSIGSRYPKQSLKILSSISSLLTLLTLPINLLLLNLPKFLLKPILDSDNQELKIQDILQDVKSKNSFDNQNKKLIEAVVTFKDKIVREVMVPRVNVFALKDTTTIQEAVSKVIHEGYSRIPVYHLNIDTIEGVLLHKDLLKVFQKINQGILPATYLEESIKDLIIPPLYTPETKNVANLLQDFKSKQMHMAIVVDEYGGTEGIVTIEDIIEEIVGDIFDEYDIDKDTPFTKQAGSWIVDAKMSLLDIKEHFNIDFHEEGDYDTIGGYIYQKSGTIPKKGFKIIQDDCQIEVISSSERGIEKVKITPNNNLKNTQ